MTYLEFASKTPKEAKNKNRVLNHNLTSNVRKKRSFKYHLSK